MMNGKKETGERETVDRKNNTKMNMMKRMNWRIFI